MTNKLLFFVLLALCFSGCDMLETHPYDVHITGERELTNKNIQLIENKMQSKKTIRFAMISDTQRWYNSTEDVVKAHLGLCPRHVHLQLLHQRHVFCRHGIPEEERPAQRLSYLPS